MVALGIANTYEMQVILHRYMQKCFSRIKDIGFVPFIFILCQNWYVEIACNV